MTWVAPGGFCAAGLDPAHLESRGAPVDYWDTVLNEAWKRKQVEKLVQAAAGNYPERESELNEGMRHYLERRAASDPEQPAIEAGPVNGPIRGSLTQERLKVMVSALAKDLPAHRKQVIEACLRVGMSPLPMEQLPADPAEAAAISVRMVDEANIYVGLFASCYGYIPPNSDVSVTEMEYNRAIERGLPCLVFFMHEDHLVRQGDVETGAGAEKLAILKKRIGTAQVAGFFKSPEDLRGQVIRGLEALRKQLQKAKDGEPKPIRIHPISTIPQLPEPYIAHSYMLMQTAKLIGRRSELTALTDWITGEGNFANVSLLAVIAIGGMGKSALTWHWFQTIAEQEWPTAVRGPLEGRVWWSFYESDAHFKNFLPRTLAYVLGRSETDVRQEIPSVQEQVDVLIRELDRRPFLLVLDGLERILLAYSGANAAHFVDDERLDDETANLIGEQRGPLTGAGQTVIARHPQRRTADPRAGKFLRRLARVRASRVLVSSRLLPSDLQTIAGQLLAGSDALGLTGLSETDALELWRAFGGRGAHASRCCQCSRHSTGTRC